MVSGGMPIVVRKVAAGKFSNLNGPFKAPLLSSAPCQEKVMPEVVFSLLKSKLPPGLPSAAGRPFQW